MNKSDVIKKIIKYQIQKKVMRVSKEKKLKHFFSLCNEEMTVLDAGVSSENNPEGVLLNYFLKNFPYPSENYTGLGIENLDEMEQLFPGKKFVQYLGDTFPFQDNQFDWVFSNGVIEHVGQEQAQIRFLNEMLRVGKNVFFTTPNKYFPVESHTQAFFLHYNNRVFDSWKRKNFPDSKVPIVLLSKKKLSKIMQDSKALNYQIFNNFPSFLPMTFTVVCK